MFSRKKHEVHIAQDALVYNGVNYPFSEFKHIDLVRTKTTQRINLINVGEPEEAIMDIILDSGRVVKFWIDESSIFMGLNADLKSQIATLLDVYYELLQRTVEIRFAKYQALQKATGYFEYMGWHLTPPDSFSFKGRCYRRSDYILQRGANYIAFKKRNQSLVDRLGTLWSVPAFSTVRDPDILFYILKESFGVSWKQE